MEDSLDLAEVIRFEIVVAESRQTYGGAGGFRKLRVWEMAMDLTESVYRLTIAIPVEERYGLTRQIRRAAVSVPSKIAEGSGRGSKGEFAYHVGVAIGSLREVQTQILLAERLGPTASIEGTIDDAESLGRMLTNLRRYLEGT
ncbi:hypothetical protein BH11ARM2_BH11ARM2_17550 [soil metagenome]